MGYFYYLWFYLIYLCNIVDSYINCRPACIIYQGGKQRPLYKCANERGMAQ